MYIYIYNHAYTYIYIFHILTYCFWIQAHCRNDARCSMQESNAIYIYTHRKIMCICAYINTYIMQQLTGKISKVIQLSLALSQVNEPSSSLKCRKKHWDLMALVFLAPCLSVPWASPGPLPSSPGATYVTGAEDGSARTGFGRSAFLFNAWVQAKLESNQSRAPNFAFHV